MTYSVEERERETGETGVSESRGPMTPDREASKGAFLLLLRAAAARCQESAVVAVVGDCVCVFAAGRCFDVLLPPNSQREIANFPPPLAV